MLQIRETSVVCSWSKRSAAFFDFRFSRFSWSFCTPRPIPPMIRAAMVVMGPLYLTVVQSGSWPEWVMGWRWEGWVVFDAATPVGFALTELEWVYVLLVGRKF
jgi:hypothetical protein